MKTMTAQDPDEKLDYVIVWSNQMPGGDTILTSTWIPATGLTLSDESFDQTKTKVWIEITGASGKFYRVTNRITTAGGRTMDRTFILPVAER